MTQEEFSAKSGIPLSTLKKYEGSHREPGADRLAQVAAMGINVNWLLTGEGQPEQAPAPKGLPGLKNRSGLFSFIQPEGPADMATAPLLAFAEGRPSPYGMGVPCVDSVLLQQVIEFFDAWCIENKDRVRIDRSRHGAVIAVLYRVAEHAGEVRKQDMEQVLGLAA